MPGTDITDDKDNDCVNDDDLLVMSVMVLKTMKATLSVDVNDNDYDDEDKANDDKVDIDDKKNSDDDKNDDGSDTMTTNENDFENSQLTIFL